MAICHIKGLATEVSLKLIFRLMSGCFGDINKMDGQNWIFNTRWCSSGYKRTSLQFSLWNSLETDKISDYAEQSDFQIAWCVWVVMFVKQYFVLQEMLSDQYWNKLNIMQPVLQGTVTWNWDFFLFQNYLAAKTMNRFIIKRAWNIILYRNLCLITMFSKFLLIN